MAQRLKVVRGPYERPDGTEKIQEMNDGDSESENANKERMKHVYTSYPGLVVDSLPTFQAPVPNQVEVPRSLADCDQTGQPSFKE